MAAIIEALAAVFLIILAGYGVRRAGVIEFAAWAQIERLVYYILFPAMLVSALASAPLSGAGVWSLALALCGGQAVCAVLAWPLSRLLGGPGFTSVFQGSVRFNTYVIYGVTAALHGVAGVQLVSPALALMIVASNALSVLVLTRFGSGRAGGGVWSGLARNPLILSCVAGLALNALGLAPPGAAAMAMERMGQAGIGLALLSVGAALRLRGHGARGLGMAGLAVGFKLVLWPLVFLALAVVLVLPPETRAIGLIAASAPVATSSYILARQMGGDAPLMAAIIAVETLLAGVAMAAWLALS